MDHPDHRSSHASKTPTLGGISFFLTLVFAIFFIRSWEVFDEGIYIIPAITVLFIIGLKDDLVVLSPLSKILAQLVAIAFIVFNDGFIINSLNGFLNINEIPYFLYLIIASFMMLTIINAYNLIDGIDGLASVVGIVILMIYTTIFYITEEYYYTLICIALNASLIAFFGFNISTKRKIFMGDTGSMTIGFVISILTLKFLALPAPSYDALPFLLENVPLIAISILIVPLFDTARVFTIRLANKKSPFSPDRNHMHHVLIDYMNLSHQQASFLIGGFNLLFVVLFIVLGSASYNFYLVIVLIVTTVVLSFILYRFNYSFTNLKRKLHIRKKATEFKLIKEKKLKKKNK